MSDLGMEFVVHARRVRIVDEDVPRDDLPANIFLKTCSYCFEIMPHYRRDDHCECSVCGLKTFRRQTHE